MAEYVNNGYGVIVSVRNGGHWVAVDRIEGSTVYMLDPGDRNTDLFATYSSQRRCLMQFLYYYYCY